MSLNGKLTPLAINTQGQLVNNSGLNISSSATENQGTWTPENYTPGSLITDTVLNWITRSFSNFYTMAEQGQLSVETYRALITIGRPVNYSSVDCPALGNTRPYSFETSYAGFGTWSNVTMDQFKNILINAGSFQLVDNVYPPLYYPVEKSYSYVYNSWGSKTQNDFSENYQWNYPYSWITGWPGNNEWQQSTDTYSAAYYPRPDIRVRDQSLIEYDEYFSNGFVATIARQAYYEMWSDYQTRRINQYSEFSRAFLTCYQWYKSKNFEINSFSNSKTFLRGVFSNINDLTTSDISGVSLAFKDFGNDLIRLGKSLNLSEINKFGLPSVLLITIQKYNALIQALKTALLLSDLDVISINAILTKSSTATVEQESKIYSAFKLVSGNDLSQICTILNVQTKGLRTLADLLDPKFMFPNSFQSLTVPSYSISSSSSKIYDFIYVGNSINPRIYKFGDYLTGILSDEQCLACGAFGYSMLQIKNIKSMLIEKFSQVVSNLEVTSKDLPLVAADSGTPTNLDIANQVTNQIALGSGNSGSYRMCDFFGAASGYPYNDYYSRTYALLKNISTSYLENVYRKLYQRSLNNTWELISRGKGWQNDVLNPNPEWAPEYAYELISVELDCPTNTTIIYAQLDLTNICVSGAIIAFDSLGVTQNTVVSSTYNYITNITTISLLNPITTTISKGTLIYLYNEVNDQFIVSLDIQNLIDAANLEILRISDVSKDSVLSLNYWWNQIGKQLFLEQRAIPYAMPQTSDIYESATKSDISNFVYSISEFASQTEWGESANIIQEIADDNTIGGQSLIAMLREARNSQRISNSFGELDSGISSAKSITQASAEISSVNNDGSINAITVTFGGYGYSNEFPPKIRVGPYGGVFGGSGDGAILLPIIDNGMIIELQIINSGIGYSLVNGPLPIYIDPPPSPERLGKATVPGSFAGSPYTGQNPISNNLVTTSDSSYTVNDAIEQVTNCNCDCWVNTN
jgi:hypothetical protein